MKALMKLRPGVGNVALQETAKPTPGPGQVVLEVKRAGICGTDLHIYDDEFRSRPPVILGHEAAGVVADVGEGVAGIEKGLRVTTETYFSVCGTCPACRSGAVNLCPKRLSIGSGVDGAFAPYLLVPAANLHVLPDSISFEAGALTEPLACCLHAVELTQIVPGDLAVVSGPGTIGLITAQLAKAAGAYVVLLGTSADRERLQMGERLGVDAVVDVEERDPKAAIPALRREGADIVFECSGAAASAATCLDLVRRRGRYSQVGLFGRTIPLDLDQVCYKEVTVTGSNASVPWAWERAVSLLASGAVQTEVLVTDVFPLDAWETAFMRFREKSGIKLAFAPSD